MQVILKKDVEKIGQRSDVVDVSRGYGDIEASVKVIVVPKL